MPKSIEERLRALCKRLGVELRLDAEGLPDNLTVAVIGIHEALAGGLSIRKTAAKFGVNKSTPVIPRKAARCGHMA